MGLIGPGSENMAIKETDKIIKGIINWRGKKNIEKNGERQEDRAILFKLACLFLSAL